MATIFTGIFQSMYDRRMIFTHFMLREREGGGGFKNFANDIDRA